MAVSSYPVNHAMAVKLWSKKLFYEIFKETWVSKFMGTSSDSMIQVLGETSKGPGDRVRVGLRMLLTGAGISGDDTLEGNEEALTIYQDDIFINQLRHATRSGGRMSEQRVPFDVRDECKDSLKDWWTERIEQWAANQLAGYHAQADIRYTGMQAAITADANHILGAGTIGTTETSLSDTATATLQFADIDKAVARAKTLSPKIRPIRAGGKDYYCLFLHPYQVYQLRTSTGQNDWAVVQRAVIQGGNTTTSPIFTDAVGVYHNVVLHEWSYIPNTISVSSGNNQLYRRAVFAGAQSAVLAYGQDNSDKKMTWTEEMFDYGNQFGVSAGMIAGMKKAQFNGADFGTIVISSYAPTV